MNRNERRATTTRGRLLGWWRRLTLWPQLVVGVTLAFTALFASFSILALRAVDASTNRIIRERLAITEMLSRDFDRLLTHAFAQLSAFDPQTSSAREQRLLLGEIYQRGAGEFATLTLFADQGRPVVSLGRGAPPTLPRLTGKHGISTPFRDPLRRPVVALGVPMRAPGGRERGVLVGTLNLTGPDVVGLLDVAKRLGRTGHADLVGPGGIALSSTEPANILKPGEHLAFYRKMLAAPKPGTADVPNIPWRKRGASMQHGRHEMAFARLSVAPWGVALGGSARETFAPAHHLESTLMLVGGSSLAVLWLLTLVGARLLVRPVRALTRAAEEMASGDLESPVSVSEGGEIGVLAESLEAMRAQLKGSLETVRRWGEELEQKVFARTAELDARNRQLAAVSAVLAAANEVHDLEGMLRRCLDVVLEHTGMDAAAVRLIGTGDGEAAEAVSRGSWHAFPCRTCTDHWCFVATSEGRPLYLGQKGREELHADCAVRADALAILPLRSPNGLVGVLTLARRRGALPTAEERPILTAICDRIAGAVENARLAAELRQLEAQHEVQRMRSELISTVSHELRTPLGFIKSYATTLMREEAPLDRPTRLRFLGIIDEETDKLTHMIDELLDASRLQTGRLPIDRIQVQLPALVRQAVEKVAPSLEARGHAVTLELADDDLYVLADELRIEQVLDNLLENASRYSEADSAIEVVLVAEDERVLITVTNRGTPIPEAELEQIFEPFYRGEEARERGVRGAGLGLAISRAIVEAHDGKLWAETLSDGRTAFVVSLPLEKAIRPSARHRRPTVSPTPPDDRKRSRRVRK